MKRLIERISLVEEHTSIRKPHSEVFSFTQDAQAKLFIDQFAVSGLTEESHASLRSQQNTDGYRSPARHICAAAPSPRISARTVTIEAGSSRSQCIDLSLHANGWV